MDKLTYQVDDVTDVIAIVAAAIALRIDPELAADMAHDVLTALDINGFQVVGMTEWGVVKSYDTPTRS